MIVSLWMVCRPYYVLLKKSNSNGSQSLSAVWPTLYPCLMMYTALAHNTSSVLSTPMLSVLVATAGF